MNGLTIVKMIETIIAKSLSGMTMIYNVTSSLLSILNNKITTNIKSLSSGKNAMLKSGSQCIMSTMNLLHSPG